MPSSAPAPTEAFTIICSRPEATPQVPALVLQSGVLRCRVPPHPAGVVRICLTNGDGRPRSRLHPFEYRDAPESGASGPTRHEPLPRQPPVCCKGNIAGCQDMSVRLHPRLSAALKVRPVSA